MVKEQMLEMTRIGNRTLVWLDDVNSQRDFSIANSFIKKVKSRLNFESDSGEEAFNAIHISKMLAVTAQFDGTDPTPKF